MVKMLYNRFTGIYKFGNNTYPRRIRRRSNLDHIFLGKKNVSYGPGNTVLTVYLPNVEDVTHHSWRTCHDLEYVLRELHISGACSSVFKHVGVKKPSSQMQNWYHVGLCSTQGCWCHYKQRQSPFQPTALWKLLCDITPTIGLTLHNDVVLGEELRGLEEKMCWRNQRTSRRENRWKVHKEEQLQPCHGLWCQTQGLGCTKYCCKYHVHVNNAKYDTKMPSGIDSIYMGCHILSSVSHINSEVTDFCSLSHLTITACRSTVVIFIITFTQVRCGHLS